MYRDILTASPLDTNFPGRVRPLLRSLRRDSGSIKATRWKSTDETVQDGSRPHFSLEEARKLASNQGYIAKLKLAHHVKEKFIFSHEKHLTSDDSEASSHQTLGPEGDNETFGDAFPSGFQFEVTDWQQNPEFVGRIKHRDSRIAWEANLLETLPLRDNLRRLLSSKSLTDEEVETAWGLIISGSGFYHPILRTSLNYLVQLLPFEFVFSRIYQYISFVKDRNNGVVLGRYFPQQYTDWLIEGAGYNGNVEAAKEALKIMDQLGVKRRSDHYKHLLLAIRQQLKDIRNISAQERMAFLKLASDSIEEMQILGIEPGFRNMTLFLDILRDLGHHVYANAVWKKLDRGKAINDEKASPMARAAFYYRGICTVMFYGDLKEAISIIEEYRDWNEHRLGNQALGIYTADSLESERPIFTMCRGLLIVLTKRFHESYKPLVYKLWATMEKTPFIRGLDYYPMIIVMGKVGHMEGVRKLFLSCLKHKTSRCQGLLRSVINAYSAFMVRIGSDPNAASHGYVPASLGGKSWNLVLGKRPNTALQDIEEYFAKHECPTTTIGAYEEISFITNILLNAFPSWPSSTIFRPYLWMGVNAGFSTLLRKQFRELTNPPPNSTYIIAIRKKFASLWFGEMIFVAGRARDFEWVEEITELFSEYLREGLFSAATLAKEVSSGKIGKELEEASVFADYVWAAATCGRWDVAFGTKKALLKHWSGDLYLQIRVQFLRKLKGRINKDPPIKDKDWATYLTRERCNAEEQQRIQAAISDGLRVKRLQQEAKGLRTRTPKFGTTSLI